MRIISQDGITDIPYENSTIYVVANYGHSKENGFHKIVGYEIMAHTGDDYWNIGDYSTKEKALQVMEMLRQQYLRHLTTVLIDAKTETTYFKFPPDESVNGIMKGEKHLA